MLEQIAQEPYEARGILHSEAAFIIHTCRRLGIKRFIESGRARGQSTYLLGKYMPDVEIHSVEWKPQHEDEAFAQRRLAGLLNVHTYCGDGRELVPDLAECEEPTAILCDGPKGAAAVTVLEQCFFSYPHVLVGFIHDMRRLDHGGPSPHRAGAVERLPKHLFSDHPQLVKEWSPLDAEIAKAGAPCGAQFEAVHGSYGPTIGAFLNH
jgi:hypothetical protein